MSRRLAALIGAVVWAGLMVRAAGDGTGGGLAVFGLIAAVVVTVTIVIASVLSRDLRKAVLKDEQP